MGWLGGTLSSVQFTRWKHPVGRLQSKVQQLVCLVVVTTVCQSHKLDHQNKVVLYCTFSGGQNISDSVLNSDFVSVSFMLQPTERKFCKIRQKTFLSEICVCPVNSSCKSAWWKLFVIIKSHLNWSNLWLSFGEPPGKSQLNQFVCIVVVRRLRLVPLCERTGAIFFAPQVKWVQFRQTPAAVLLQQALTLVR